MRLKLYYYFLFIAFFFLMLSSGQNGVFAQGTKAQIVIGNASPVYMKMNGGTVAAPIYLVTDNDLNTGIIYSDATIRKSWIISEGEFNYLKWNVKARSGDYTIPWGYGTTTSIPLIIRILAAGTETAPGSASITFSTYHTAAANNLPLPTSPAGITLGSTVGGGPLATVDRFWSMDAQGFVVNQKPLINSIDFYYDDLEWQNGNTDIPVEGNLQAQRWNSTVAAGPPTLPGWEGETFLKGTDVPADDAGYIGNQSYVRVNGPLSAGDFYKWWVLVNKLLPLPVTWLNVAAECNRGDVTIKWSTASEQNSDYFTVERSYDGTNFTDLANVLAAGQSSTVKNYSWVDEDPISGVSYYRIRETDFNSSFMHSALMTVNGCSNDDIFIYGSEGGVSININAVEEGQYNFELYDILGQKLMNEIKNVSPGSNHLKLSVSNIASAMYIVKVFSSTNVVSKKVFVRSAYTQ